MLFQIKYCLKKTDTMFLKKLNSVVGQFLHGELNYIGYIPQDTAVDRSVRLQKMVMLNEPNSKSFKSL